MLLRTVRATVEKYNMLSGGERVVVAVSGGPDSVALLHVLWSLRATYRLELHAAHLEHGLRGEAALEDQRFVEGLCRDLGVGLTARSVDIPERAAASTLSVEAVARQVRYAFLDDVLRETRAARIATGHNANDQAETLLLNLIRGSGISGLRGIRPAMEGTIIRPLIEARRDEILAYLAEKRLDFRTDASNEDSAYDRNRLRKVLIPLIEQEFNPRIVDSLVRTAGIFSLVAAHFDGEVELARRACCRSEDGRVVLSLEKFAGLAPVVTLFTLYAVLRSLEGDDQVVSYDTLMALVNLAERSRSGSRVDVGSGISAVKEFGDLVIGRDVALPEPYELTLVIPGTTRIEQAGREVEVSVLGEAPDSGEVYRSGEAAYFDLDKLSLPLTARSWREGDRIAPFGLAGSKKVHDVFVDEKIPASERASIPIICDKDEIIWIAGVRRSERARITDETRTFVRITTRKDGRGSGTADGQGTD
jgi:tRNA(Ile)-lysidine synthase